ncbi:NADH-ubiquinone oxidoreductase-F iron-sulfur binding region domain-containing protein [Kitasatospora sp. NPDC096204]|uniref:NADH-ubiquinone oxidoreductase-F iron-sulfur binding region domain-containing protein n=1 Tax=Kitasatospora sp. NPDC096204 TaxID=3364094 RepID=UPI003821F6DF
MPRPGQASSLPCRRTPAPSPRPPASSPTSPPTAPGSAGPCLFGLPAVADDFTALADGHAIPDLLDLLDRLHHRIRLLPGRGACRHPDGAARLAASALTTFDADVDHHLRHGHCRRPTTLPVPPATRTEHWT